MYSLQHHSHAKLIQSCYRRKRAQKELARRRKMVKKRRNVSNEILYTEREYVMNIETLVEAFLKPLLLPDNVKNMGLEVSKEFGASLSGVVVILQFHRSLLADLEKALANWSTNTRMGELFEPMAPYLKFYSQYVTHYQTVVKMLTERKADKQFQNLLENLKPQRQGKGIKDFMIMPIQRIPRYQMLLAELIKSTWRDHIDYENLVSAHDRVKIVAETLENQSADALSITKVLELASSFQIDGNSFKIVVPYRRYIAENDGFFASENTPIEARIFLFNDLILVGKPKKERFKIIGQTKLTPGSTTFSCTAPPFGSKLASATRSKLLFTISTPPQIPLQFAISPNVENKWEKDIKALLSGERIWLPHEENQKKSHTSIIIAPSPSQPQIRRKGRFSGFFKKKDDAIKVDKSPTKEATPRTLRVTKGRSSSFELEEPHSGFADSIIDHLPVTDDESMTTHMRYAVTTTYDEQTDPVDEDSSEQNWIGKVRKSKRKSVKKRVASARIPSTGRTTEENIQALKDNIKRKRRKHRSNVEVSPRIVEYSTGLRSSTRSPTDRAKKKAAYRKSNFSSSVSEYCRSTPYT